jgi:hypothetical protein
MRKSVIIKKFHFRGFAFPFLRGAATDPENRVSRQFCTIIHSEMETGKTSRSEVAERKRKTQRVAHYKIKVPKMRGPAHNNARPFG